MREMSVSDDPLLAKNKISNVSDGIGRGPTSPVRRMERNKSGPQSRSMRGNRAPPKRTQSSKIGRPTFDPVPIDESVPVDQGKRRGVNRSQSSRVKGTTRNAPARTGSFQRRRVPDRASSSTSLRRGSKRQSTSSVTNGTVETDDVSVTDSVFTSISIQTMDSIMIRKKQMPLNQGKDGSRQMSIEFDEQSDYYEGNVPDGDGYEYEEELSVFSESWCSSDSYEVLSDYEEGEMDGAILEDDEAEEETETTSSSPLVQNENECTSAE